jgi:hypothetical protein
MNENPLRSLIYLCLFPLAVSGQTLNQDTLRTGERLVVTNNKLYHITVDSILFEPLTKYFEVDFDFNSNQGVSFRNGYSVLRFNEVDSYFRPLFELDPESTLNMTLRYADGCNWPTVKTTAHPAMDSASSYLEGWLKIYFSNTSDSMFVKSSEPMRFPGPCHTGGLSPFRMATSKYEHEYIFDILGRQSTKKSFTIKHLTNGLSNNVP